MAKRYLSLPVSYLKSFFTALRINKVFMIISAKCRTKAFTHYSCEKMSFRLSHFLSAVCFQEVTCYKSEGNSYYV